MTMTMTNALTQLEQTSIDICDANPEQQSKAKGHTDDHILVQTSP
jgi:predicted KAP-like P-loop ATPase